MYRRFGDGFSAPVLWTYIRAQWAERPVRNPQVAGGISGDGSAVLNRLAVNSGAPPRFRQDCCQQSGEEPTHRIDQSRPVGCGSGR